MKNVYPKNIFLIIILLLTISCKIKKINIDTYEIVNSILKDKDSTCLFQKTYFLNKSIKPINALYPYFRVYSYNIMNKNDSIKSKNISYQVFLKNVDGVISKNELLEMKIRYPSWSLKEWNPSLIKNKKIKIISLNSYNNCNKLIRISEPLFTKDKLKAIVYVYSKISGSGGSGITILKKVKEKWRIVGSIPNGTSD
jgi:hypothetical protein